MIPAKEHVDFSVTKLISIEYNQPAVVCQAKVANYQVLFFPFLFLSTFYLWSLTQLSLTSLFLWSSLFLFQRKPISTYSTETCLRNTQVPGSSSCQRQVATTCEGVTIWECCLRRLTARLPLWPSCKTNFKSSHLPDLRFPSSNHRKWRKWEKQAAHLFPFISLYFPFIQVKTTSIVITPLWKKFFPYGFPWGNSSAEFFFPWGFLVPTFHIGFPQGFPWGRGFPVIKRKKIQKLKREQIHGK